jgi:hypothetical protein
MRLRRVHGEPRLDIAPELMQAPCPYRKLNPDVSVVQSAQNSHRQYATA